MQFPLKYDRDKGFTAAIMRLKSDFKVVGPPRRGNDDGVEYIDGM